MIGIDGDEELEGPLTNVLVDHVHERGGLEGGIARWLGNAIIQTGSEPPPIAEAVSAGELDLMGLPQADEATIHERVPGQTRSRLAAISQRFEERAAMR